MDKNFHLLKGDEELCEFFNKGVKLAFPMYAYSKPKSFIETKDDKKNKMYVNSLLFHEYVSAILPFLRNILFYASEYYPSTWRTFAENERLERIKKGHILPTDKDAGGSLVLENIPNSVLEPYTMRHCLCPDDTDEVLKNTLDAFDIRIFFQLLIDFASTNSALEYEKKYGIKPFKISQNGSTIELSSDDASMQYAVDLADIYEYRVKFIFVTTQISALIMKIEALPSFKDNFDEINEIEDLAKQILYMEDGLKMEEASKMIGDILNTYFDKENI
ncbi:hypothetical protein [Prevotella amnii]|nr:hypothetical protein [Prevotella amnii]